MLSVVVCIRMSPTWSVKRSFGVRETVSTLLIFRWYPFLFCKLPPCSSSSFEYSPCSSPDELSTWCWSDLECRWCDRCPSPSLISLFRPVLLITVFEAVEVAITVVLAVFEVELRNWGISMIKHFYCRPEFNVTRTTPHWNTTHTLFLATLRGE